MTTDRANKIPFLNASFAISFLILLFLTQNVIGQEKPNWVLPTDIKFTTYTGDTTFFSGSVSVWRIKKGDTLLEFYPDGNLQSISQIRLSDTITWVNTDKTEKLVNEFERNGVCNVYLDDTTKKVVASGQYKNNERVGDWSYYDTTGKLIEVSQEIAGYLIKKIDYSSGCKLPQSSTI